MRRIVRSIVPSRLRRAWRAARYRRLLSRLAGPKLLQAFGAAYPSAVFIEIGSNAGDHHDHLRPLILSRQWRGLMVEPVPYVFDRLRSNYGDLDRVTLVNVAVADRDGTMPFYHLREAGDSDRDALPEWYDGLGSFSREAVLSHGRRIPDIERFLVTIEVPCLTFASLCETHGVEEVNLLLLDTEGYDWELLQTIDIAAVRPRLVIYEHYHLDPGDRAAALERLRGLGYEILEEGFDTFCLDPVDDDLTKRFRRLAPAVAPVSVHDEP
jgi:FkbM family methyltransferase